MQNENESQQQRRFRLNLAGINPDSGVLGQYLGVPFSGQNPYEESYKSQEQTDELGGDPSVISQFNYHKVDWDEGDDERGSNHDSELAEQEIKDICYEEWEDNLTKNEKASAAALNGKRKQIAQGELHQEPARQPDNSLDEVNLETARRIEPLLDRQGSGPDIPYMDQELLTEIEENKSFRQGPQPEDSEVEFALSNSQRFSSKASPKAIEVEELLKKKTPRSTKNKFLREEPRDLFKPFREEGKRGLLEPVLKAKKLNKPRPVGSVEAQRRAASPQGKLSPTSPILNKSSPRGQEKRSVERMQSPALAREIKKRPDTQSASKAKDQKVGQRSQSRENESAKKAQKSPGLVQKKEKKALSPTPKPKDFKKPDHVNQSPCRPEPEKDRKIISPPITKSAARSPSSSGVKKAENEASDNESSASSKSTAQQMKFKVVVAKKLEEEKVKYDKFLLAPKTLKIIKSLVKPQKPLQYCCYSLICLLSGYNSNIPRSFLKLKEEEISWTDIRKFLNETCEILTNERNFRSFVSHLKLTKRHINQSSHYLLLCRKSLEEKTPFSSYCTDIVNFVDSILDLHRQEFSLTKERSSLLDESSLVLSYQPIPERQPLSEFEKTHSEIEKNISPLSKESSIQQNNMSKAEGNTINHILDELDEVNGVNDASESDVHNNEVNGGLEPIPVLLEIQKESQRLESPEKLQEKLEKLQKIDGVISGNYLKKISMAFTRPKLTMLANINSPTSPIFSIGRCIILILSLYVSEIPFSVSKLLSLTSEWAGTRNLLKTSMNKLASIDYTKAFTLYQYETSKECSDSRVMNHELLKKITAAYYQFEKEKLGSEPQFVFVLFDGVHAFLELYRCCTGNDYSILQKSKDKSKQKIAPSLSPARSPQQTKPSVLNKKKSKSPEATKELEAKARPEPKAQKKSRSPGDQDPSQYRKALSPTHSVFLQQHVPSLSNKLIRDFSSKSRRYDSSDETRGSRLSGIRSTGSISPKSRPQLMNRAVRASDIRQEKASCLGSSGKKNPKFFNNKQEKRPEPAISEEKALGLEAHLQKAATKHKGASPGDSGEGIGLLERYFIEFITDKIIKEKEEIAKLDLKRFQDYVKLKIMKQNFDLCKAQWIEDFKKIYRDDKWKHSISFLESLTENHTPEKSSPQPGFMQEQNIYNVLHEKICQTLLKFNLNHDDLLASSQCVEEGDCS